MAKTSRNRQLFVEAEEQLCINVTVLTKKHDQKYLR
ncbi:hypothetical protein Lpp122_1160 [Lacticaseibacillus paracasei subsp. paracasei Lpp122]|uniref:Uncharacterized protein n=1 Tax=Lacticaseibacillus paracasei subsp. paracasei Lpp122 TaxID=1256218 RepID=A0A8E0I5X4_LACPA|nr:hypothetical protein Lpp122_1160 [Lacticaseibacillus paracasei subsp. paracasei Lpp122]